MRIFLTILCLFILCSCSSLKYSINLGAQSDNLFLEDTVESDEILFEGQGTGGHISISEDSKWFLTTVQYNYVSFDEASLSETNDQVSEITATGWEAVLSLNFPYIKPRFIFGNTVYEYEYNDEIVEVDIRTRGYGIGLDFEVAKNIYFYMYYDEIKDNPVIEIDGVETDDVINKRVMAGLRFVFFSTGGGGGSSSSKSSSK